MFLSRLNVRRPVFETKLCLLLSILPSLLLKMRMFFFVRTKDIDLFREMAICSQYLCNFLATLLYMKMGSIFSPVKVFMW